MASEAEVDLVCSVSSPLLERYHLDDDPDAVRSAMSTGEWRIVVSAVLEGQVFNGGFTQFYFNYTHAVLLARHAAECYLAIGAPRHESLVRRSIAIAERELSGPPPVLDPPPKDTFQAFNAMREWTDLHELDSPWYELESTIDLYALKAAYIRANPSQFPTAQFQ